jgi:2-polyprenyl-6-methoxyphenol hydroxylase-like FAD-dependent oxidoreductase
MSFSCHCHQASADSSCSSSCHCSHDDDDDDDASCKNETAPELNVIVGGGIAGLAVAAALQNIASVQHLCILEQQSSCCFYDESQGAALILGPNGLKALRAIGGSACLDRVLEQGSQIKGNVLLHTDEKQQKVVPDKTLERTSLPQVLIRWGVLRRILQDLLSLNSGSSSTTKRVKVCTGVEATDYQVEDKGRIQVLQSDGTVIQLPNDDDDNSSTSLLIAANGIHSNFSKRIHPNTKNNIKDNGRVNIKAVVKKQLPIENTKGITYSYFQGNIACFAGPAGDDYTYWAISLQNDDSHSHNDMDDLHKVKQDLLQTLSTTESPSFIVELIKATAPHSIYVRQSQESIHVEQLYSDTENVVLVGDAAHAMSPSYGQCGSMALEDAVTLAFCISHCDGKLHEALYSYSQARTSRSEEMVKRSAERTQMAVRGQTPAKDVSQWIFQWEPPEACTGASCK